MRFHCTYRYTIKHINVIFNNFFHKKSLKNAPNYSTEDARSVQKKPQVLCRIEIFVHDII